MVWMQNFGFNHKLVAMVWCPLSTKGQGALDHKGGELVGKKFMVGQIFEKLVEEKDEAYAMEEEGVQNLLAQIGNCGVLWILSTINVFPLSSGNNQGGYGVVPKERIKRFNRILSMIELVGKTPKTDDKQEAHK